jgi:putative transposase
MLADAAPDLLAFAAFPKEHWKQIWSNNPRSGSTRSSAAAPTWLAFSPTATPSSALSAPCSPSSTTSGLSCVRYMSAESLAKARLHLIDGGDDEEGDAPAPHPSQLAGC